MSSTNDMESTNQGYYSTGPDTFTITNYSQLESQLSVLHLERDYQELVLKDSFHSLITSLNLVSLFKAATNHDRPAELAKSGITLIINLITNLILGKHRSIKGYLSSIMVERFTTMIVDNNLFSMIAGLTTLFNRKKETEKDQE
ncbi:MAG: hypothetical protein RBT57_02545 [Paludibacter sp.]|jgi:hypothetical protein|nr:hypothetical protein [Paludibacter sp.]